MIPYYGLLHYIVVYSVLLQYVLVHYNRPYVLVTASEQQASSKKLRLLLFLRFRPTLRSLHTPSPKPCQSL